MTVKWYFSDERCLFFSVSSVKAQTQFLQSKQEVKQLELMSTASDPFLNAPSVSRAPFHLRLQVWERQPPAVWWRLLCVLVQTCSLVTSRLKPWLSLHSELSFVAAATTSSPFNSHQTGGELFQAESVWAAGAPNADRPTPQTSKRLMTRVCSPLKWRASLILLRPDGLTPLCSWNF